MNKVTNGRYATDCGELLTITGPSDAGSFAPHGEYVSAEIADNLLAALIDLYDATTANDPERIREARVSSIIAIHKATKGKQP